MDKRQELYRGKAKTVYSTDDPAFVVMHDSSLDEVCRKQPGSIPELLAISGFGEHKAALYGPRIFEALKQFRSGGHSAEASADEDPMRPISRASGL